jgi:hypothetical protein
MAITMVRKYRFDPDDPDPIPEKEVIIRDDLLACQQDPA